MTDKKLLELVMKSDSFETFKVYLKRYIDEKSIKNSGKSIEGYTEPAKAVLRAFNEITNNKARSYKKVASRLSEGFSAEELILVIKWANETWEGKWAQYVRFDTLFRSKEQTDKYLTSAIRWQNDKQAKIEASKPKDKPAGKIILPKI